jgi:hypothetical protein
VGGVLVCERGCAVPKPPLEDLEMSQNIDIYTKMIFLLSELA